MNVSRAWVVNFKTLTIRHSLVVDGAEPCGDVLLCLVIQRLRRPWLQ